MSGTGAAILDGLRRSVGTRARRVLIVLTLLLGLLAAVALATAAPPGDRTLAAFADPVQSLMSVVVPAFGILLAHDLKRSPGTIRLAPTPLAATVLAAAVGLLGLLMCVAALALTTSDAPDPWRHLGTIAVGSVLVQVVAQFVGTGLGLLIRRPGVAFAASIALPLGLWLLLGAVDVLRPAQALTPYATVRHLLSGRMSGLNWVQWLAVLLTWGVGLNALGWFRFRRAPSR
jgi:ABC-type transport system involved in multi-copper enzyme maturation permease subunit